MSRIYSYNRSGSIESEPFTIANAVEMVLFRDAVNNGTDYITETQHVKNINGFSGKYCKVIDDIDMIGVCGGALGSFVPISSRMACHFDGDNHYIKNLYISGMTCGLFGAVQSTTIKNLTIKDSYVEGSWGGGIFCMTAKNTRFENCLSLNNTITNPNTQVAANPTGGICGVSLGGCTFVNCINSTNISVYGSRVGGILGDHYIGSRSSSIINCLNTGKIISMNDDVVGGIAGVYHASMSILNSLNFGYVKGRKYVGGIAGYCDSSNLRNRYVQYNINLSKVNGIDLLNPIDPCGRLGYADNQRCISESNTSYFSGSQGLSTSGLVGMQIRTGDTGGGFTDENWHFENGMYPLPAGIATHPLAMLSGTPVFFAGDDNVDSVTANFTVGVRDGLVWSSENGNIQFSGANATITQGAEDTNETIIATYQGYSVKIDVIIKAAA